MGDFGGGGIEEHGMQAVPGRVGRSCVCGGTLGVARNLMI
jgi:hypothetical protein